MIVKKIKNKNSRKLKAWQIGDLVDYIRSPHDKNPLEKVEYSGGRNFLSRTHTAQKLEMISLANESVHSRMPVQHWLFSWKENEQPTKKQIDEVVDIFLERMELAGHQAIYGLHHDTENYHLHIAVSRMNPETLKVIQPHRGFDIEEAHKIVALLEHKQGWISEENARYAVLENGEIARRRKEKSVKPKQAAIDFECAKGEKSAQRIAQERGHDIIKNAVSWGELHQRLAAVGLRFEKKGSGAIIFVGETAVKASSVDRDFGMTKLCKKWGDFTPGEYPENIKTPQPEPVSPVNGDEWKQYQTECAETAKAQQTKVQQAYETREAIEKTKVRHREERKQTLSRLAKHGLPVLNIARHAMKVQQALELRRIRRQTTPKKNPKKPRFEAWLRAHGLHKQADRWRYRAGLEAAQAPQKLPENPMPTPSPESVTFEQYATAVNAGRYRVTCIKMEAPDTKKTFILDKKNGVTKGFTPDELLARIPEMLRLQRRGENLYYTPLSEQKHHILIDDMTRDSLKKLQEDGFRPAVILESSPGNYQCILTVPKLASEFDKDVGNRLTERLNRLYGDKKLSGCIHPHRAPGFQNRKPKHRREDGSFPQVKLRLSEKRECSRALELSRQIDREYAEAARAKMAKPKRGDALNRSARPGDAVSAYHAHLENIRRHLSIEDYSRVDAMIALRMRSTGHSRDDVAKAIQQCAPTIREAQERRDWQRYAERTAAYAFGVAGDVDLAKNERYAEHWRKIEGIGEPKQEQPRMRMR